MAFVSPVLDGEEPGAESHDAAGDDDRDVNRRDFAIAVHKLLAYDKTVLVALPDSRRACASQCSPRVAAR